MRLVPLLILAAIVGGAVYVIFFTNLLKKGQEQLEGFGDAKTALKAMEHFRDAVKARKYGTAAKYCTREYAELLRDSEERDTDNAKAAAEMGRNIDNLMGTMKGKGYGSAKAVTILHYLDPFPGNFKIKGTPEEKKKDKDKFVGIFQIEKIDQVDPKLIKEDMVSWDPKMFAQPLVPHKHILGEEIIVEIVKDGEVWKLDFKLAPKQAEAIRYYTENHVRYKTALGQLRGEVSRFVTSAECETELCGRIAGSKK